MSDSPRFETRAATADDLSFIMSSWLNAGWEQHQALSLRSEVRPPKDAPKDAPKAFRYDRAHCRKTTYMAGQKRAIAAVLGACPVLVAHPTGAPDEIAGWVCYDGTAKLILACYVKHTPWRRQGVGSLLMQATGLVGQPGVAFGQFSRTAERFYSRFFPDVSFDPFVWEGR